MPKYKFTYFNGRGRGELSRMLFAAADKSFEDKRIDFSEWSKLKPDTPQGSLPVLEADGVKMCQSFSIARFLAREFGLYGKRNVEAAIIDQILDTLLDLFTPFVTIAFSQDKEEKTAKLKEFNETTLQKELGYLETLVKQAGKNGFAVGPTLTVADLALYVYIENCQAADKLGKFPLIAANRKKVEELPKIAKYLKNRPVTEF